MLSPWIGPLNCEIFETPQNNYDRDVPLTASEFVVRTALSVVMLC